MFTYRKRQANEYQIRQKVPELKQMEQTECIQIENDNFSGRTEKQAVRDAIVQGRAPPIQFKRTPSRRQPRRCIDGILDNKNNSQKRTTNKQEIKSISIPQPAQA